MLAAAAVLMNYLGGFTDLGIGSIIIAIVCLLLIVHCFVDLNFSFLPVPLAVMYLVFQKPFGFPFISPWVIIIAALLLLAGLSVLFPKPFHHKKKSYSYNETKQTSTMSAESKLYGNNPSVSVSLAALNRRLTGDAIETVNLQCNFGSLSVFFDQALLHSGKAEVIVNCSFGSIELIIPRHWQIINRLECTLGGVDDRSVSSAGENAPALTLKGNVSFGSVEIKYL